MRLSGLSWDSDPDPPPVKEDSGLRIEFRGGLGEYSIRRPTWVPGQNVARYLLDKSKIAIMKRCRMIDLAYPDRGTIRTRYVPEQDSHIVILPAGRGLCIEMQRSQHDAQRLAKNMKAVEHKL